VEDSWISVFQLLTCLNAGEDDSHSPATEESKNSEAANQGCGVWLGDGHQGDIVTTGKGVSGGIGSVADVPVETSVVDDEGILGQAGERSANCI
jgi:hypothetical protein